MFWDLFGEQGHPVRTTVSEMGPLLLARLLGLNDTQEGVLAVAFEVADDQGLLLLDLKDLRALMSFVGERADELSLQYGRVSTASVGAIQRRLLTLEQQGGEQFFGEPALDIRELMRTDLSGQGIINVLAADRLMAAPKLYATFLLWLLSELFEELPEVGDPPKPKLVFFFDEAHLLVRGGAQGAAGQGRAGGAADPLQGRGGVLLHARTRSTSRTTCSASWATGSSMRCAPSRRATSGRCGPPPRPSAPTPSSTSARRSPQLGVGEALVSTLQDKGVPSIVERTLIRPPCSRIGPATVDERRAVMGRSPVAGRYDQAIDRESAYEVLQRRAERRRRRRARPPRQGATSRVTSTRGASARAQAAGRAAARARARSRR